MGKDRPSLFDYKACTWVLWKIIVDSFDFGIDVYHNTEDESQPLIDWYRESRNWKKKWKISPIHGNREHFCMNSQELDSECIILQSFICVNVEQIKLKWNDKDDACSHFHACSIHVASLAIISLKKSLRKGCYQMAHIIIVWSWPFSSSFASSESWRPVSFF